MGLQSPDWPRLTTVPLSPGGPGHTVPKDVWTASAAALASPASRLNHYQLAPDPGFPRAGQDSHQQLQLDLGNSRWKTLQEGLAPTTFCRPQKPACYENMRPLAISSSQDLKLCNVDPAGGSLLSLSVQGSPDCPGCHFLSLTISPIAGTGRDFSGPEEISLHLTLGFTGLKVSCSKY